MRSDIFVLLLLTEGERETESCELRKREKTRAERERPASLLEATIALMSSVVCNQGREKEKARLLWRPPLLCVPCFCGITSSVFRYYCSIVTDRRGERKRKHGFCVAPPPPLLCVPRFCEETPSSTYPKDAPRHGIRRMKGR